MKKSFVLFIIAFLLDPTGVWANACLQHIQRVERQEGIPRNLLVAMARVESGRYNGARKMVEPWPWTVQQGGKSNYFKTKAEAVSHVRALQRKGIKNIDVGCMQMNMEHHGHKFASLEDMFEPAHNVTQGAKYLKQLKMEKNRAWSTAVGNYHSFTPEHHNRYKTLVMKNLSLVNREGGMQFNDQNYARGSLFPAGGISNGNSNAPVKASLYTYSRARGMVNAKRPAHKATHKTVKASAKARIAQMKGNGVHDLAFMRKKDE